MAAYEKMYAVLCAAIDSVIDPLNSIPSAAPYAALLEKALLQAEEIYCETASEEDT